MSAMSVRSLKFANDGMKQIQLQEGKREDRGIKEKCSLRSLESMGCSLAKLSKIADQEFKGLGAFCYTVILKGPQFPAIEGALGVQSEIKNTPGKGVAIRVERTPLQFRISGQREHDLADKGIGKFWSRIVDVCRQHCASLANRHTT
jgi:hypothetical protein